MQRIPQIVRERLKPGIPAASHPDADLLTAFAEHSLTDPERTFVIEHLSRCNDCRDIVALSLPEIDLVQPVAVPSRRWWMTWPAFRWGFATAGVAIIIAMGIVQYERYSNPSMMAKQVSHETMAAQLKAPAPSQPLPSTPEAKQEARSAANPAPRKDSKPNSFVGDDQTLAAKAPVPQSSSSGKGMSIGGQAGFGPKMPTQWQQQRQIPSRVQALSPPNAPKLAPSTPAEMPQPSSQMMEVQSQSLAEARNNPAAAPTPSTQAEQLLDNLASPPVGKAKAASTAQSGLALTASLSSPRWSITSAGGLQRSFDQGSTWQNVDVNATSAPATNFVSSTSLDLAVAKTRAKQKTGDKKADASNVAAPVFRAVVADGSDVWAGGSNGALYHSLDSGNNWSRIVVSANSTNLTADIVGLQFSDPQHGTITTATPEVWTTSDGGQTWQKQ